MVDVFYRSPSDFPLVLGKQGHPWRKYSLAYTAFLGLRTFHAHQHAGLVLVLTHSGVMYNVGVM